MKYVLDFKWYSIKNYDLQQKLVLYLFQLFKANEFVSQTQDTSQI